MTTPSPQQVAVVLDYIREAVQFRDSGSNESRLRHNLSEHLGRIYAARPWWVAVHTSGTEDLARHNGHTGFIDTLVGRTVVEYEPDLRKPAKFREGHRQVRQYAAARLAAGEPIDQLLGVLSDTVRWHVYNVSLGPGAASNPGEDDIVLTEIDKLDLEHASTADATELLEFLPRWLGREGSRTFRADTITRDMGFDSPFGQSHLTTVESVVTAALAADPDYADLIARLWVDFVDRLSTTATTSFDADVYSGELYLVTFAKLLCANVIAKRGLRSDDAELETILNGAFFAVRGLRNLVEYDYFGWLNRPPHVSGLVAVARDVQRDLRAYDFTGTPDEDVFGELLAQLARKSRRLLLGQEMTPSWLVTQMVTHLRTEEAARGNADPAFLDICAGSGAMLVGCLKALLDDRRAAGTSATVTEVQNVATGFDIDPMAVMLAKVNWVIAARDVLEPFGQYQVSIPIYHADSIFTEVRPEQTDANGNHQLALRAAARAGEVTPEITVPGFLVTPDHRGLFDALVELTYDLAMLAAARPQASVLPARDVAAMVAQALSAEPAQLDPAQDAALTTFVTDLVVLLERLQRDGRNGVWGFILRNSFRPTLISGQFSALITNPPWLALSKIADNPYRERLRGMAKALNITPRGASHLHSELSTVALLHAVDRYLAGNAIIGCVLPETVLNGDQHAPFRSQAFASSGVALSVTQLWRVEEGTFKNESIVLFGRKDPAPHPDPIPGRLVTPTGSTNLSFAQRTLGRRSAWDDIGGVASRAAHSTKGMAQGADFFPRTVVFHELAATAAGTHRVHAIDAAHSANAYLRKLAKKQKDFSIPAGVVADQFVFDILLSSHLVPFLLGEPAHGVLPFVADPTGWRAAHSTEIIGPSKLLLDAALSGSGGTVDEFFQAVESDRRKLTAQNGIRTAASDPTALLIVYGAGGTFPAAAFLPLSALRADRLMIDQTLYWSVRSGAQAEDEAHYLTGMINSLSCVEVITAFQPRGAQGKRHIHTAPLEATPDYDPADPSHQAVVAATKALAARYQAAVASEPNIAGPNGHLPRRRTLARVLMASQPGYQTYEDACRVAYGL